MVKTDWIIRNQRPPTFYRFHENFVHMPLRLLISQNLGYADCAVIRPIETDAVRKRFSGKREANERPLLDCGRDTIRAEGVEADDVTACLPKMLHHLRRRLLVAVRNNSLCPDAIYVPYRGDVVIPFVTKRDRSAHGVHVAERFIVNIHHRLLPPLPAPNA